MAREPHLDPGVRVVVGHDPGSVLQMPAREADRDTRRDAEQARMTAIAPAKCWQYPARLVVTKLISGGPVTIGGRSS